jgi:hypothetical protein
MMEIMHAKVKRRGPAMMIGLEFGSKFKLNGSRR